MELHDQHVFVGDLVRVVHRHTTLIPSLTEPPPGEMRPMYPHLDNYLDTWRELKAVFDQYGINLDEGDLHEI